MPALDTSTVVIVCPHCGTRYQVGYASIGRKGRTVSCAHCQKSWEAHAEAPPLSDKAERALDDKFAAEERRHKDKDRGKDKGSEKAKDKSPEKAKPEPAAVSAEHQQTLERLREAVSGRPKPTAEAPDEPLDPAALRRQQQEFSRRQRTLNSRLPIARLRRAARIVAGVSLVVLIGGGIAFRVPIVSQFPQLAAPYAAVGLGVNVVGLEFEDVKTLLSLQQGVEVLAVQASIHSVASGTVPVPQVIVTLLGAHGEALYEWSVLPKATDLAPGEAVAFDTGLSTPPRGASNVKLSFSTGRNTSGAPLPLPSPPGMAGPSTSTESAKH